MSLYTSFLIVSMSILPPPLYKFWSGTCSLKSLSYLYLRNRRSMILVIGEYKINCQNESSDVADHCRQYALSDSKVREYQVIILLEFSYIGFLSILHLIINILLLRRNDIISKLISICYFLLRDKGVREIFQVFLCL